ncbi:copper resistance system multicopper oxidase [Sphingosinicella sp. LHD-64]|uniref:copper resistance system multicopper oxidase n=1 Tax=Sphingosinicella sp. LHD-64 TaxID=3072139 RepID=UPI0028102842|nr:copper resistance system multicopper oxidase [Sphingosinicella sp. LHD-64]MDQ8757400.1 copper resistance system multicopper oxidase [Sphingosinicella sp. LHD-64]
MNDMMDRRTLLRAGALSAASLGLGGLFPAWAQSGTAGIAADMPTLSGEDIRLTIGHAPFTTGGRTGHAVTINGTVPAPLIRLREGQNVRLRVTNTLDEDTSIHWHGLILPFQMDGVPGVSFPGIRPRETFTYEFPVRQSGTYWFHSHSGLQEQQGHYGPLVIDPAGPDPVAYDREHVIVLSDWSFLHPHQIITKLRQQGGYFNRNRMTLAGRASGRRDQQMPAADRAMFAQMRMDPTDILDVNGTTYTFLINGHGPDENWTGLFRPGERVRLRIINAAAMTIFNVRIPGLPMSVVNADGQNVRPVTVDEFQISVAETYDVVVQPGEDRAYTFVAEAMDRSGLGRATLAPRLGMTAPVPPLRERPVLTMRDMGMDMGGMDHGAPPGAQGGSMPGMNHGSMQGMDHGAAPAAAPAGAAPDGAMAAMGGHSMRDPANAPQVRLGPGVDMIAPMPQDRTGDPGLGLDDVGHKVLTYRDLVALTPGPDQRPPARTVEIHLTGNMERFMWSFDGVRMSEGAEPIRFERNERVRVKLVNDSMMAHPIHLHGHFFEIVNGHDGAQPLKHTVNVLPGGFVRFDLTADAPGDWAFHCHLLFHMHAGMMRVVSVRPLDGDAA